MARGAGEAGTRRLPADEARRRALKIAREQLLAFGPAGVTLNRVAAKMSRAHSTLLHHFGSAEELQAALMSAMVDDLAQSLTQAMAAVEPGEAWSRVLTDIVFDAFDRNGAALLAAWIVLSNKERYLEPIREAVHELAEAVDERLRQQMPDRPHHLPSALLFLSLCAFGDALVGERLARLMGRERDTMRELATQLLPNFFGDGVIAAQG